jgi:hypothetical protein
MAAADKRFIGCAEKWSGGHANVRTLHILIPTSAYIPANYGISPIGLWSKVSCFNHIKIVPKPAMAIWVQCYIKASNGLSYALELDPMQDAASRLIIRRAFMCYILLPQLIHPGFQAGWSDCMHFFSLFLFILFAHLEIMQPRHSSP